MKDIENVIFTELSALIKAQDENAFITGEFVNISAKFPTVSITEISNTVLNRAKDFDNTENLTDVQYEIEIYTKGNRKKTKAKEIRTIVDDYMSSQYFERFFCQPIPNIDTDIFRYLIRYRKII